ncbi:MAG: sugar transferase [Sphingomonadales bacterium]|nr:sugar transferase [Sphingomonadales bacterium]
MVSPERYFHLGRQIFALALLLETVFIVSTAVVTGLAYHLVVHDTKGPTQDFLLIGLLIALFYSLPGIVHAHYHTKSFFPGERGYAHLFRAWNFAFLCIAVVGFLTKSTEFQSRGWLILLYSIGLLGVAGFEGAMVICRRGAIRLGLLTTRRLLVVGTKGDIERFTLNASFRTSGIKVVATALMPEPDVDVAQYAQELNPCARNALDAARTNRVSDIVVLTDWANAPRSSKVAEKLMDAPAAVHLGGLGLVEQFPQLGIAHLGTATTVVLRLRPLGALKSLNKRIFDVCLSSIVLLALAPVLLTVALLIKYDSKGPVFFRQLRRGFNQKEFRIWKFRTMTADDGDHVVQASEDGARTTRVGRILSKWNIDELPQLINVLKGDMSLVGPRSHAVAHDSHYERIIERYGRRLNVKPGITGWAQIHGHRGPTQTKNAMQARVAHDLHYIENCSLALDIYILGMTVLSRKL